MLILMVFAGCTSQKEATANASPSTATTETIASDTAANGTMFTDRDKEIGYSEAESTTITLNNDASVSSGNGVTVKNNTVTISSEGTYILSGSLSNGQIVVDAADDAKIQIVLNGVDISNESTSAIYVKNADKVFLTTASNTENTVSVTGEYVAIDDNNIDAVIFAKSDLTLNGAGTLTISSKYGHGVVSKDDLAVTSGTYAITAASNGLSGKNSVRIADGTFAITAGKDGIHSENTDDTTIGFVYIEGGTINIIAEKQGIQGTTDVSILGGTIDITKSYEGIEGLTINISGGDVSLVASDDGLNAAGGNDGSGGTPQASMSAVDGCLINISGGKLTVDAKGDGIDSNGGLTISGGVITVSGPTENMDGTIDYNGTATITGGTLLGAGSSGMVQGFSDSSTQGSILYVLTSSQQAGTAVTLKDASGKVIAQLTPAKQFQSVNLSVPELASGATYTLTVGSTDYTIAMTATTFSNSTGAMGGGQGGGQKPQGGIGGAYGVPPQGGMGTDATSSATVQQ